MTDFFKAIGNYYKDAEFGTFTFWMYPLSSLLAVWLLTIIGIKIFSRHKKLKTVFIANRAWLISSQLVACILIGLICFWWAKNYFSENPLQFSLLCSLFIVMLIPIICFIKIKKYYSTKGLKEIIDQPKTPTQLDAGITFTKIAFRRNKLFLLIPLLGFAMLLFILNKGNNLISIVLDNTQSQQGAVLDNAKSALEQTLYKLTDNNQIVISIFGDDKNGKSTLTEIRKTKNYNPTVDVSTSFSSKTEAINYIPSVQALTTGGSPIMEVIWQNYLFAKQTAANITYKNKILIIITDGKENHVIINDSRFFCNSSDFTDFFAPQDTYMIDYSEEQKSDIRQIADNCGYITGDGRTKEDFSFSINNILNNFQNNWYMVFWTILIYAVLTLVAFLIEPQKII